jgi:hypothetical protein
MAFVMALWLRERRAAIVSGTSFDLFDAVVICMRCGLVVPAWLSAEFRNRYAEVRTYRVGSLDEAFGPPLPAGLPAGVRRARLHESMRARLHKDRLMGPHVVYEVERIVAEAPGTPIDHFLFETVAERMAILAPQFKLGRSECERLYYERRLKRPLLRKQRIRAGITKRR